MKKARFISCFCLKLLLLALSFPFFGPAAFSAGFVVDPSQVKASGIVPGKEFEITASSVSGGYFLSVRNMDPVESNYTIEFAGCKQTNNAPLGGYEDIEDAGWLKADSPEITVPAGQTGYIAKVSVKVPKGRKYFGRKFQAMARILKKAAAGQSINLEILIPVRLETVLNK